MSQQIIRRALLPAFAITALALFAPVAFPQALQPAASPTDMPNQVSVTTAYLYLNKMHFAGTWSSSAIYNAQDTVTYNGSTYVSVQIANLNNNPASATLWWAGIGGGGTSTPPLLGAGSSGLTAALPGTCTPGQLYFATDATAGQNIYECGSANVWTQQLNSGAAGASTSLNNLSSVNINTSLLSQAGVDLGSTTKAIRNLFLYGSGTYGSASFEISGNPSANRILTLPDTTDTFALLNATQTFTNKTWNGVPITGTYGGTGLNNGAFTLALAGNVAFTGAFNPTFAIPASGTWTFPAAGTLVNTLVTTLANLAGVGTIATGAWQGTPIGSAYGGAGTINGILKANGSGVVSQAAAGTDYAAANASTTVNGQTCALASTCTVPTSFPVACSAVSITTGAATYPNLSTGGSGSVPCNFITSSTGAAITSTANAGGNIPGATAGQLYTFYYAFTGAVTAPVISPPNNVTNFPTVLVISSCYLSFTAVYNGGTSTFIPQGAQTSCIPFVPQSASSGLTISGGGAPRVDSTTGNWTITTSLGDVVSLCPATSATSNQFVTYIDKACVVHTAQPAFSNLSGTISNAQLAASMCALSAQATDVGGNGTTGTDNWSTSETAFATACGTAGQATSGTIDGTNPGLIINLGDEVVGNATPTFVLTMYACQTSQWSAGQCNGSVSGGTVLFANTATNISTGGTNKQPGGMSFQIAAYPGGTAGTFVVSRIAQGNNWSPNSATGTSTVACGATCTTAGWTIYFTGKFSASGTSTAACGTVSTTGTNCFAIMAASWPFLKK